MSCKVETLKLEAPKLWFHAYSAMRFRGGFLGLASGFLFILNLEGGRMDTCSGPYIIPIMTPVPCDARKYGITQRHEN